jgi:hypothetical protein
LGSSLGELFDDARDLEAKDLGGGRLVSAGAFEGMFGLWKRAHSLCRPTRFGTSAARPYLAA